MNLQEFKAWFEGFTEGMDGPPGERSWARIKEKVKAIKEAPPITREVFIHDYYRPWRRWWGEPYYGSNSNVYLSTCNSGSNPPKYAGTVNVQSVGLSAQAQAMYSAKTADQWDPQKEFRNLGRAESSSLKSGAAD